jgi:hypothetical protein
MEDSGKTSGLDIEQIVQRAVQEYMHQDTTRKEPAYKAELQEERRRREQLEKRLNEVVAENKRNRQLATEAERATAIRSELQQLGVAKIELAYKAVQDGIYRSEDGRLVAKVEGSEVSAKEFLAGFVADNPEFLPARISGGSGITSTHKAPPVNTAVDIDKISPSMDKAELERVRQEILRVASQTLKG